ncbi:MAG: hypothetical protein KBD01_07830 [Acidobacteria bacterium]|nr:hypothetical protein [Acidobacteriota bacterium]
MDERRRRALGPRPASADDILRESEAFFMGRGNVHESLARFARAMRQERIPFVIVGGMALNLHGSPAKRSTSACS